MRSFALFALCFCCNAQEVTKEISLRGVVRDVGTRQPVAGVTVALVGGVTGPTAQTNSEGAYVITGLRPGRISLEVSKDGYATLNWMNSSETSVNLSSAREVIRNFDLSLAGSIAGRVIDSDSERPITNVRVTSLHENYLMGTKQYWFSGSGSGDTVRDGRFAITRLLPGEYLIEIDPEIRQKRGAKLDPAFQGEVLAYPHSFFPDVPRVEMATTISVAAGEKRDLTIRLRKKPVRALRGSVELPKGTSGPISYIVEVEAPGFYKHITQGKWPEAGPFEIGGLSEGDYTLLLSTENDLGRTACFLEYPIVIGNRDVENLRLHLSSGLAVSGRLLVEKEEPKLPEGNYQIALNPVKRINMVGENLRAAVQGGSFQWSSVLRGDYFTTVRGLPVGWAVSRLMYQTADRRDRAVSVGGSGIDGAMDVYVTSKLSTVSGLLQDSSGHARSATLVLVPQELPDDYNPLSIKIKATDEAGSFAFSDIVGGRYSVLAPDGVEAKSPRDFRLLRSKLADAERIEVVPGQNVVVHFRDR